MVMGGMPAMGGGMGMGGAPAYGAPQDQFQQFQQPQPDLYGGGFGADQYGAAGGMGMNPMMNPMINPMMANPIMQQQMMMNNMKRTADWGAGGSSKVPRTMGEYARSVTAGQDGCWSCVKCNNVNFPKRTECNKCKEPRTAEQETAAVTFLETSLGKQRGNGFVPPTVASMQGGIPGMGMMGFGMGMGMGMGERPAKRLPTKDADGNWTCKACGNINWAVRTTCNRCPEPKPADAAAVAATEAA